MTPRPQEIAAGVHGLSVGGANVYFVRSASSWVLIDAASANCGRAIRQAAGTLFGADTRPASILLTHAHPDHVGSVLDLARTWDCPAYISPGELPLAVAERLSTVEQYANPLDRWLVLPLLRAMPSRRVESMLSKTCLKGVARAFDPGAAAPDLPDWECVPTPGHSPGHVAFFRASDRVLISGDALLTVDVNWPWGFLLWALRPSKPRVSLPPWYTNWNKQAVRKSVAVLAGLEPRVLASGHGAPLTGDGTARDLRALADRFSDRAARQAGSRGTGASRGR